MKTDIEIAHEAKMLPIKNIAPDINATTTNTNIMIFFNLLLLSTIIIIKVSSYMYYCLFINTIINLGQICKKVLITHYFL